MQLVTTPESPSPSVFRTLPVYVQAALLGKTVIHPGGRWSLARLAAAALADPPSDRPLRILDVGCGAGTTARRLGQAGAEVCAIDIDRWMLSLARRANAELPAVEVRQADVERLPFPDDSFDRVVTEAVLMFVDRPRALAEIRRVLRPGGRLIAHEFCWLHGLRPRFARALYRQIFPTAHVDGAEGWEGLLQEAGFGAVQRLAKGPSYAFTPPGVLIDEGPRRAAAIIAGFARNGALFESLGFFARQVLLQPWIGWGLWQGTVP